MAQFAVYRNRNEATRARVPLLLDVQSDLLDDLASRVVVPLLPANADPSPAMAGLTPLLTVAGTSYLMLTPQLAGISRRELGPEVDRLQDQRGTILAALDFLVSGF